jgi:hypothetical protein
MATAAEAADMTRAMAKALVRNEERRTGSRMLAYETAARLIGTSTSWVRKFVGDHGSKEPSLSVGLRIVALYDRLIESIEADAERMRVETLQLRAEFNETLPGAMGLVEKMAAVHAAKAGDEASPPRSDAQD